MMHLLLTLIVAIVAICWRLSWLPSQGSWQQRWHYALSGFLLPPILLFTTAVALVCMGPRGNMVCWWEGWSSYSLGIGFLLLAAGLLGKLALDGWRSLVQVRQYEAINLFGTAGRLLPTQIPYIAQVGFWQAELVVSQGLLTTLTQQQLAAVLHHEAAHADQHDTFWFFWLGWLRRLTCWLPKTDALWQELLLLRELRADRQAVEQVDGLLLAEALLTVVSTPMFQTPDICAAFSEAATRDRLTERIDALLGEPDVPEPSFKWKWAIFLLSLLPFLLVPFHV